MDNNTNQQNTNDQTKMDKELKIKIPENTNVFYTDSAFVNANKYGITIDFAQSMGPTNQQTVVARVGMSKDHAEALMNLLQHKIVEMQAKADQDFVDGE